MLALAPPAALCAGDSASCLLNGRVCLVPRAVRALFGRVLNVQV